jgi:hypothetical protein
MEISHLSKRRFQEEREEHKGGDCFAEEQLATTEVTSEIPIHFRKRVDAGNDHGGQRREPFQRVKDGA